MGLRERFRRRPGGRGADTTPSPADASDRDWPDAGWRGTAPMSATFARADMGVMRGLAFRDRLASWQDHSLTSAGMGHAVDPAAPVGVMHTVLRRQRSAARPHPNEPGAPGGDIGGEHPPLVHRRIDDDGPDPPAGPSTSDPATDSVAGPATQPATHRRNASSAVPAPTQHTVSTGSAPSHWEPTARADRATAPRNPTTPPRRVGVVARRASSEPTAPARTQPVTRRLPVVPSRRPPHDPAPATPAPVTRAEPPTPTPDPVGARSNDLTGAVEPDRPTTTVTAGPDTTESTPNSRTESILGAPVPQLPASAVVLSDTGGPPMVTVARRPTQPPTPSPAPPTPRADPVVPRPEARRTDHDVSGSGTGGQARPSVGIGRPIPSIPATAAVDGPSLTAPPPAAIQRSPAPLIAPATHADQLSVPTTAEEAGPRSSGHPPLPVLAIHPDHTPHADPRPSDRPGAPPASTPEVVATPALPTRNTGTPPVQAAPATPAISRPAAREPGRAPEQPAPQTAGSEAAGIQPLPTPGHHPHTTTPAPTTRVAPVLGESPATPERQSRATTTPHPTKPSLVQHRRAPGDPTGTGGREGTVPRPVAADLLLAPPVVPVPAASSSDAAPPTPVVSRPVVPAGSDEAAPDATSPTEPVTPTRSVTADSPRPTSPGRTADASKPPVVQLAAQRTVRTAPRQSLPLLAARPLGVSSTPPAERPVASPQRPPVSRVVPAQWGPRQQHAGHQQRPTADRDADTPSHRSPAAPPPVRPGNQPSAGPTSPVSHQDTPAPDTDATTPRRRPENRSRGQHADLAPVQRSVTPRPPTTQPAPALVQRATPTTPARSAQSNPTGSSPPPPPSPATSAVQDGVLWPGSPAAIPITVAPTAPAPPRSTPTRPAGSTSTSTDHRVVLQRDENGGARGGGEGGAATSAGAVAGVELDELARRLVEPIGRLLRADLRQGRERAGHLYDRRR